MKTWFAQYYVSQGAEPVEASVLASERSISFTWRTDTGDLQREEWPIHDIKAAESIQEGGAVIRNTSMPHCMLVISDKKAVAFINDIKEEMARPWHRQKKNRLLFRAAGIFLGLIGVLVSVYFLLVPWLSENLATRVSVETEQSFGDAAYQGMSLSQQTDIRKTAIVNSFFDEMNIASPYNIRITVVNDNVINAFALPGGHIVVYTALLDRIDNYAALAALLSHEFTHVNNRHSTRSIFRKLGSKVFLNLLLGNTGSVTSILIDKADDFKSLTYSRELEKEADMQGLQLLLDRNIDPAGFDILFRQLRTAGSSSTLPEFLQSHPDIDKRIDYIREASKNAVIKENEKLQAIFNQLKNK